MKKLYPIFFILSATILLISSCKKKEPGLGIYTCNIDGIAWSATKETIALHAGLPLNIIGRDDSTTLIINLQDVSDIGTYHINDSSTHFAQYTDGPGTFDVYKSFYQSSGEVIITELSSTKVKGTFTLNLSNSFVHKQFTNGVFEIEFQ